MYSFLARRPRLKARATTEGIEYGEEYEGEDTTDDESDSKENENTEIIVSLPRPGQVSLFNNEVDAIIP